MNHIHHISTGGTIAADAAGMLGGADLLEHLGIRIPGVRWTHEDAGRIPSSRATPESLASIASRIDDAATDHAPGMVLITHGTDTMEESAFVADMVCRAGIPVVFTGAMRVGPGGDGPGNVVDAVRTGLEAPSADRGVTVVMDGSVHAASEVRKLHSAADDAFRSRLPLATVGPGRIRWRDHPPRRLRLPHAAPGHVVRVIRLAAGDEGEQIFEAAQHGVDGLVVELFGAGNAPSRVFDAIHSAARSGVCIALTSRCGEGPLQPARAIEDAIELPGVDALKARLALIFAMASDSLDSLRAWGLAGAENP